MRALKFRAWHKQYSYMTPVLSLGNGEQFDTIVKDPDGTTDTWRNDELEIMQFTGLKDKNGKEIYEGDIVSGGVYYGWSTEKGLAVVRFGEWEQDGSGYEYGPSLCLGFFLETLKSEYGYGMDSSIVNEPDKHNHIEVIGNIYENPELLK